jgi:hypothetical protein
LYAFSGGNDGYCPLGSLTLDAQGNICGTALDAGAQGFGTVFEITP